MTDPIADMLTRIRNAAQVQKPNLLVPYSKMKQSVAEILQQEGYISRVTVEGDGYMSNLKITLRYDGKESVIRALNRVSKPGRRVYVGYREIPVVRSGYGTTILSTPKGILSAREAKKQKLGGELLCEVY